MRSMLRASIAALTTIALAAMLFADGPSLGGMRRVIDARFPGIHWVDAPTLARWLRSDAPPLLLDARRADEFAVSHLAGAQRIDPDRPDWSALPSDPSRRIVVYCSVGYRSGDIAAQLQRRGYGQVFNLEEGLFGWANEGRPIVQGNRPAEQVHPYDETWGRMLRAPLRAPLR